MERVLLHCRACTKASSLPLFLRFRVRPKMVEAGCKENLGRVSMQRSYRIAKQWIRLLHCGCVMSDREPCHTDQVSRSLYQGDLSQTQSPNSGILRPTSNELWQLSGNHGILGPNCLCLDYRLHISTMPPRLHIRCERAAGTRDCNTLPESYHRLDDSTNVMGASPTGKKILFRDTNGVEDFGYTTLFEKAIHPAVSPGAGLHVMNRQAVENVLRFLEKLASHTHGLSGCTSG